MCRLQQLLELQIVSCEHVFTFLRIYQKRRIIVYLLIFLAASDFQPENRTLTFSSGDESASILILILNDEEYEGVEEFYATLTTADSGVRIFAPDATIEIIDDG